MVKIKVLEGLCESLEVLGGTSVSLAFPASGGCLHSLAQGSLPPSTKPVILYLSDHSSLVTSHSDYLSSYSIFKDTFDFTGLNHLIQNYLSVFLF